MFRTPELPEDLSKKIRLVRRDIGSLLFHFTRDPGVPFIKINSGSASETTTSGSPSAVLRKILHEGTLIGTGEWTDGYKCVCFTEAPIQEFNAIFSLVALAASQKERPRYEPYGIAVSKNWLFSQGGRPVIYDAPEKCESIPESDRYRFAPYDPTKGIDFTWEREWRIATDSLKLDPKHTLVVVPTADEAFEFVYEFAKIEAEWDVEGTSGYGSIVGSYHVPHWLAVSLDLFGFE